MQSLTIKKFLLRYVSHFEKRLFADGRPNESDYEQFESGITIAGRSQWPRGLRRRSSAARLLRLWIRVFCVVR